MKIQKLFSTIICQGIHPKPTQLNQKLMKEIAILSRMDKLGRKWSLANYDGGYTSYGSVSDLHYRFPIFSDLSRFLQPHAEKFAKLQKWETRGLKLVMTALWVNVMGKNTYHSLHLHPHSVLSGTYYVSSPQASVALRIEDPRMSSYMNAPVKRQSLFYDVPPRPGKFVIFESWLRHEVPKNQSRKPRISLSFNYSLEADEA